VQSFAVLEPCLVGIEASGSAHYCPRVLTACGHTVRRSGGSPGFRLSHSGSCSVHCSKVLHAPHAVGYAHRH